LARRTAMEYRDRANEMREYAGARLLSAELQAVFVAAATEFEQLATLLESLAILPADQAARVQKSPTRQPAG
jgi:hypothetical protein